MIAATTLFLGFKSVEVVRNESITTAEANMPTILSDDGQGGPWPDPLGLDSRLSESGQPDIGRLDIDQQDIDRQDIDRQNSNAAEFCQPTWTALPCQRSLKAALRQKRLSSLQP